MKPINPAILSVTGHCQNPLIPLHVFFTEYYCQKTKHGCNIKNYHGTLNSLFWDDTLKTGSEMKICGSNYELLQLYFKILNFTE
jgi:hypothetical protein